MNFSSSRIYHGGGAGKKGFSGGMIDTDIKAAVSALDTTPDFLQPKIIAGSGISIAKLNPGGNEQLQISAPGSTTDELVKISATDTTPGFLNTKLTCGNDLHKSIISGGGDERLQLMTYGKQRVSAADTSFDYLSNKLVVGGRLTKSILNPGANETLEVYGGDHFVLLYQNPDTLVPGDFLYPPEMYSYAWPATMGYYTDSGFKIKKISVLVNRYQSLGNDSFYIRFREYIANGSKTAQFATGQGNLIGTVYYNVVSTGGSMWYYLGGYDNIDWTVSSGYALFCYLQSSDVDVLHGLQVWIHCYKDPI